MLDSSQIERSEPWGLSWELKLDECSGASLLRTPLSILAWSYHLAPRQLSERLKLNNKTVKGVVVVK